MAKNRNEIPEKLTWDLTTIYKTDKEWEAEPVSYTHLKELSKEFDRLSFKNYFVKIKIPIIDWYLFIRG